MSLRTIVLALAALSVTGPALTAQTGSPYKSSVCPIPAGVRGYTVVVRPEAGTDADSAYLREIANVAGAFFEVPRQAEQAAVLAVIRGDGSLRRASLAQRSGDGRMDRTALASVRQVFEPANALSPRGFTVDSLVVRVLFGEEPREGETTFRRFSAQSRLPELRTERGGRVAWPADLPAPRAAGAALVWVKFNTDGTASIKEETPIQASDSRLIRLVRELVPRLQFTPGQSDCEPQTYTQPIRMVFSGAAFVQVEHVRD